MTDLETSMATIIAVFQKYSKREGDAHKLKKSELRDLLNDELPDLLGVRRRGASEPGPGRLWGRRGNIIPAAIATKHFIQRAGRSQKRPAVDFVGRFYTHDTHIYKIHKHL